MTGDWLGSGSRKTDRRYHRCGGDAPCDEPVLPHYRILIWNTDKGPIFYTQERLTKDGKIFRIYKFRTMIVDAEKKSDR